MRLLVIGSNHLTRGLITKSNVSFIFRYVGQPEVGDKSRFTICRSVIEVGTSSNLVTWLNELGFRLDYEFVAKGHIFQKGRMKILVQKVGDSVDSKRGICFDISVEAVVTQMDFFP